jgi:adenylosuccinate synthase
VVKEFELSGIDVSGMSHFEQLPEEDKTILAFISKAVGVKIGMLGVGPRDDQLIVRDGLRAKLESQSLAK